MDVTALHTVLQSGGVQFLKLSRFCSDLYHPPAHTPQSSPGTSLISDLAAVIKPNLPGFLCVDQSNQIVRDQRLNH